MQNIFVVPLDMDLGRCRWRNKLNVPGTQNGKMPFLQMYVTISKR